LKGQLGTLRRTKTRWNDERAVVHKSKRKEVPGGANQLESSGKVKRGNKNLIAPIRKITTQEMQNPNLFPSNQ
jgi:hypothetical protein